MGHGFTEDSTGRVWRRNSIQTSLRAWRKGWKFIVSFITPILNHSAHFLFEHKKSITLFISVKQKYPFPFLRSEAPSLQLSPYYFTIQMHILHCFTKTYTLPNYVTYFNKNITTLLSNMCTVTILSLWSIYFPTCTIFSWWYCRNQPTPHLEHFFPLSFTHGYICTKEQLLNCVRDETLSLWSQIWMEMLEDFATICTGDINLTVEGK